MNEKKNIYKEVQTGLNAGKSKTEIYNELTKSLPKSIVERSLAQWPLPEAKKQNRPMNIPLIVIAMFFALLALFRMIPALGGTGVNPRGVITVLLYFYTVYGIINCNLIGYMLIILVGANNIWFVIQLIRVNQGIPDSKIGMILAMSAAGILLAIIQKRKLFPNTSWFMRHKRDDKGNPIF